MNPYKLRRLGSRCTENNAVTTDCRLSKQNLNRVNKALQSLVTTGDNYKGDYCGKGKIKLIANKISTCNDDVNAAKSCATRGVFQNSKYTYINKDDNYYYCNTYIDCDDFNSSNKDAYFTSYQVGKDSSNYKIYNDNFNPPDSSIENLSNKINHFEKEM